jgi:hypothetical protein
VYSIGQVLFVVLNKKSQIYPMQVIEIITKKTLQGECSYHTDLMCRGPYFIVLMFLFNLYLITMHSSVYKINTQTLVADYIGSIKGLPTEFTTNGAAVNENGELVISGAAYTKSYFTVDISTLQVTGEVKSQEGVFNASDLASSNLLYQAKVSAQPQVIAGTEKVSIYPNPAVGKKFQVKIAATNASDKYSVEVTDIRGKVILQNNTAVGSQLMKVDLPTGTPAGLYFLKVTNTSKQTVYNNKLVVE